MGRDYIIFTVSGNYYAIEVECVERIIQPTLLTSIPHSHPYVEGMMSYEQRVTKVVNFRKMTNLPLYEDELVRIFDQVKSDHKIWVETLQKAIEENREFTLTTDPHACRLGKWLDSYSTHDTDVLAILKVLRPIHNRLHEMGKEILRIRDSNPAKAVEMVERDVNQVFHVTMGQIEKMIAMSPSISAHLQKLLIYRRGEHSFAIKIDGIEDMAQIEMSDLKQVDEVSKIGSFLEMEGVVERNDKLVNVIKSVTLPVREVK